MPVDFYLDAIEITNKIKWTTSRQDCERIIQTRIKELILNRKNDEQISLYLKKLSDWLENNMTANRLHGECENYRHAVGIIDTLLKINSRKSWVKTMNM